MGHKHEFKKTVELSPEDLALLGGGALGYIREIEVREARKLLGGQASVSRTTPSSIASMARTGRPSRSPARAKPPRARPSSMS